MSNRPLSIFKEEVVLQDQAIERPDMCKCSECGGEFKCDDLQLEEEQDGWENPVYWIHVCPVCENGGCIDDYFHSEGRGVGVMVEGKRVKVEV